MEVMQPNITTQLQQDQDFVYEIKYDGFRACLFWAKDDIRLISRNNIDLTENFPEIILACQQLQAKMHSFLPIQLDGELVVLNNEYQANFELIQKRGRLKTKQKIEKLAKERGATFIAFDLLQKNEKSYKQKTLSERKKQLMFLFEKIDTKRLQVMQTYDIYDEIAQIVFDYKAEGIIAKRRASKYRVGKKHHDWFKLKNWRKINVFLTEYNPQNDYFTVAAYEQEKVVPIGKCKHGLTEEVFATLRDLFITNGEKQKGSFYLPPAICAAIHTLDLHANELREPEFATVLPNLSPLACTMEQVQLDLAMLPEVEISNADKIFWPQQSLTKADLLTYMREMYAYIIPYVKNRALTIIRCPDGIEAKTFFQKNLPNYAPDYIEFVDEEDKRSQLCNNLKSLIWFATHSAIEYHIPFQRIDSIDPIEIVFDLDPPNREKFSLAIEAARMIKQLLDDLELISFIKTSGNKGLQIHIPIMQHTMSYEETAIFTEAIAKTIEAVKPELFTTERFKKNRGEKLYIDYVQHGKNKTIIAPYSPRKTTEATVSTPIFWEEVNEKLHPTQFTIKNVAERVRTLGCPWLHYDEATRTQKLTNVLKLIQNSSS